MWGLTVLKCKVDSKYTCYMWVIKTPTSPKPISGCMDCLIFAHSEQLVFTNKSEVINISLEKDLAQKAQDVPEFLSVTDLPDTMKLLLVDYKFKTDARGNDALFLYLKTKDGKMVVQKYTASGYDEILTAIKDAGGSEHLKIALSVWEKKIMGRMQKQRLVPKPEAK